jgi:putative acetyltransferase
MKKPSQISLRKFQPDDLVEVLQLFYETVHTVNRRDYSKEQVEMWAPSSPDVKRWADSLNTNITYVAELNSQIVGFGNITSNGHLDKLYTHKNFQGQGIGSCILHKLEEEARKLGVQEIRLEASITAKPFFEQHGYTSLRSQEKKHSSGLVFLNYVMRKKFLN